MAKGGTIKYGIEFNVNQQQLNTLKRELQNLKALSGQNLIDLGVSTNLTEANAKIKEFKNSISQLETVFNKSFSSTLGTTNLTKFNTELQKINIQKIAQDFQSMGVVGQNAFRTLTTNILTTNLQLKESNTLISRMADTMSNTIKWGIASSALNTFTGSVSKAFNYVRALDSSLNDIRIVTNKSAEEMERFAISANRAAQNLGASTKDYTNAALIYYQQGLSDAEANARAAVTLKTANVTRQTASDVSEQLTAVWNGYRVSAAETEKYIDKLAAVAASTAADLEELSTGMAKVASAANLMGVDIDQLNAQLATIVSVTKQAPESVGTALKTIYARMGDIEAGVDSETTLGNYTEKMKNLGINILDSSNHLRAMGEVIEEVGSKWNTFTKEQQIALSQAMAGTRQYNNLLALFENWNMYSQAIETSKNSLGTLQHQQDIYMESTSAHLQQLSTATERIYKDFIDTKGVNNFLDIITKAVSGLGNYIEAIGGSKSILMQVGAAMSTILGPKIAQGFATTISNFKKMKDNAKQLNAEVEVLKQFKGIQINDEAYSKLVNMKQELINLNSTLTNEQREYGNSLIQTTNELMNQRDAFLAERNAAQDFYNLMTGNEDSKLDLSQLFSFEDATKINEELDNIISVYETKIGKANEEIRKEVIQNRDTDVMNSFLESAHDILNNKLLQNEKAITDLAEAVAKYEKIIPEKEGIISDEQIEQAEAFRIAYSKAADLLVQKGEQTKKIILQQINGVEQGFKNNIEYTGNQFDAFVAKIRTQYIIEGFTKINSSILMISSSIQSIGRLGDIWGDENISTGEKILQTILAVSNAATGLINIYRLVHTTADTLSKIIAVNSMAIAGHSAVINKNTTSLESNVEQIANLKVASDILQAEEKQSKDNIIATNVVLRENTALLKDNITALNAKTQSLLSARAIETKETASNIKEFRKNSDAVYDNMKLLKLEDIRKNVPTDSALAKRIANQIEKTDVADAQYTEKITDNLVNTVKDATKETTKSFDEIKNKGSGLFKSLKSDWATIVTAIGHIPPQAWIAVGAVAAIATSVYLVVEAINHEENALKNAVEETQAAAENARNTFKELSDSVSSYKNAQASLEGLTEGTLEWYDAIVKTNEAAQKLIETWGLLAGEDYYFDRNGLITIKSDTLTNKVFEEQQKVYRAQAGNYDAQADYIMKSKKGGIPKVYENVANAINDELKAAGSLLRITEENAKAMLAGENQSIGTFSTRWADLVLAKMNDIETDVEASPEKLGSIMKTYQAEYNSLLMQAEALRLQSADQSIRGFGFKEDVESYSSLSSSAQNLLQQYVANQKDANANNYEDINLLNAALAGGGTGAGIGAGAGAVTGPGALLGAIIGFFSGVVGGIGGALIAQNENEKNIKKLYAEHMLGYSNNNGIWTDPNGKILKEEDVLNSIDYDVAKNAYNSGDTISRAKTKESLTQLSQAKQIALNNEYSEESSNYIAQGVFAAQNKLNFDYSLLTPEELKEVRSQVGFTTQYVYEEVNGRLKQTVIDLSDSVASALNRMTEDINNFNSEIDVQASAIGTTSKALKLYGQTVRDVNGNLLELNQTSARLIAQEFKFNKVWNEGVDVFEENKDAYEEYLEAVRTGGKISYKTAEAVGSIQEALENTLGYEVSSEYMETYAEDIQKLFGESTEDAEEAYNKLKDIALDEEWNKIGQAAQKNSELTAEAWEKLKNTIQDLNELETLDEDSLSSLRNYITAAQMSYEELQQFLDDNHLVVTTDVPKEATLKQVDIPGTTETRRHTITGEYNPYTGKEMDQPLVWEETVENLSTPYYTLADNVTVTKDSTNFNGSRTNFTRASSGSKQKTGGTSQPNKKDEIDTEIDRYHKINTQITKVNNSLSQLQIKQDKFVGAKLLKNLNNQWNLLNTQIDNYNKKLKIANDEQTELANKLLGKGVVFNDDGTINNYAEAIRAQENYVNSLIRNYNSMSREQQENYQVVVDQAQKDFEQFQKDLDRYDELVSDFIPQLQKNILDAVDKQIEINVEKFDKEITITIDMNKATREWNAWKKRILDDIKEEDILGNSRARLLDFGSYFNEAATGDIQVGGRHLSDLLEELYKYDAGEDNIYGHHRAQALEELRTYYQQLMTSLTEVQDLQDEIYQNWLDEMDRVQEKFDKQIASYEFLRKMIEHDMKVIQLTLGTGAYGELIKFYQMQSENYEKQLDFQRRQRDFWYEQMQNVEENSKEWDSTRAKWESATQQFNTILETSLENSRAKFENFLNDIFDRLNDKVTNGFGLDYVKTEWDLINKNADRYLDTINASYGIRALEKKYQDSINNNNNVVVQQKIKKLMDAQLETLKSRERITQYDIDRANKLYDIEMARIALEEAQQNKSKMRLRRDSQGNYSYQYVGDEQAILDAMNNLNALYNDLYNFDKDRYKTVLNDIYEIWNSYQEAMHQAALINDPEERAEKERLIQEQYNELMMQAVNDYEVAKYDLQQSFFWDWVDLNKNTEEEIERLSQTEKEVMLNEMIPIWKNGVSEMADVFLGEGGFAAQTIDAWNEMKKAEVDYADDMTRLSEISGQTYDTIIDGQDTAINQAEVLIKENQELINAYGEELAAVEAVYREVKKLRQEYEAAEKAAKDATKAAYEYEHREELEQAEAARIAAEAEATANAVNEESYITGVSTNETNENSSTSTTDVSGGDGVPNVGDIVTYTGGAYYGNSWGGGSVGSRGPGRKVRITYLNPGAPYPIHVESSDSAFGWLRKDQISGYDTGGYTGTWNSSGRLAFLHQKELVLNPQDTENMLNTVAIMRSLAYSLGSTMLSKLAGVSANGYNGGTSGGVLEQNVHIDAQFPNVHDAREIEQALNNLINAASQRALER